MDAIEVTVGRGRAVPLLYVDDGGLTYVVPSSADARWSSRVLTAGGCEAHWPDGRRSRCAATLVPDPLDVRRLLALFRSKYGEASWVRYFSGTSKMLVLDPDGTPAPRGPEELLRLEFDAAAAGYDTGLAGHPIDRYLKDRVARLLVDSFAVLDPILEIGPGTGYHTLPLLAAGHRVTAVDLSPRMLEVLRDRATESGYGDRLVTREGRLGDLDRALFGLPPNRFQGIVSAFGAFNLEPFAPGIRDALGRQLSPRGRLVFTTLNRPGLTPMAWEFALGRPHAAGVRLREEVPADEIRYPLAIHLRTPRGWDRVLAPTFHRRGIEPISILAPPFESSRSLRALGPAGQRRVRALDTRLVRHRSLWPAAEWLLLTYEGPSAIPAGPDPVTISSRERSEAR